MGNFCATPNGAIAQLGERQTEVKSVNFIMSSAGPRFKPGSCHSFCFLHESILILDSVRTKDGGTEFHILCDAARF
jgi:hypothetical protein